MGFFWLIALLTVAVLLILLLLAIFRTDVIEFLQTDYIEDYRVQNPNAANLTDEEILPLLPADEKETLDWVSRLYVPVVVIMPVVLLLWFVFLTGRLYGEQRAGAVRITSEQFPEVYEMWESTALAQGLKKVHELYTINGNGALNADLPPIFVPPAMLVQQGQGVEQQAAQSPGPAAYRPASCEA